MPGISSAAECSELESELGFHQPFQICNYFLIQKEIKIMTYIVYTLNSLFPGMLVECE